MKIDKKSNVNEKIKFSVRWFMDEKKEFKAHMLYIAAGKTVNLANNKLPLSPCGADRYSPMKRSVQ